MLLPVQAVWLGKEFWLKQDPVSGGIGPDTRSGAGPLMPAYTNVLSFIAAILPNIYIISGVIMFILMVIGGIGVIQGAGNSNDEQLKKGQQTITSALLGFLLIFLSYWIIQLIKIITGVDIFGGTLGI